MGRKPNPTCVYCAKNYRSEDEAKHKHPECYAGHNCAVKRYRLRNKDQVNAKRRELAAKKKGLVVIEPITPQAYRAELVIYGKKNQFVHAIALKIYKGNELTHQMQPQHTQGIRQPELKDYIDELLEHLSSEYNIDCFGLIYWLNPQDCPQCKIGNMPKTEESQDPEPDPLHSFAYAQLIQRIDHQHNSPVPDAVRLRQSGELVLNVAHVILKSSERLLKQQTQSPINSVDTVINADFVDYLTSLTQQSIATDFFNQYLTPRPRKAYERSSIQIESLSTEDAIAEYAIDEAVEEVLGLAHHEDINHWVETVEDCLINNLKINTLPQIVKATKLSIVEVFIALLFGKFNLVRSGEFYDGFRVVRTLS